MIWWNIIKYDLVWYLLLQIQAIRRYKITLMTRSYGRGTDFVCRDQGLVKHGGVHIIVTFLPEDESEHKQLMGRTCRQDDPGLMYMCIRIFGLH
jgi:preprotein translocase subunit SecA